MFENTLLVLLLAIGGGVATVAWAKADQNYRIMQLRMLQTTHDLQQLRKDVARGSINQPLAMRSQELEDALQRIGQALSADKKNDANTVRDIRTILATVAPQYAITAKISNLEQRRSPEERTEFLTSLKGMIK